MILSLTHRREWLLYAKHFWSVTGRIWPVRDHHPRIAGRMALRDPYLPILSVGFTGAEITLIDCL
jgi:hypothetical protein